MRRLSYVIEQTPVADSLGMGHIKFIHHGEDMVTLPRSPEEGDSIAVMTTDSEVMVQSLFHDIHFNIDTIVIDYKNTMVMFVFAMDVWYVNKITHSGEVGEIIPVQDNDPYDTIHDELVFSDNTQWSDLVNSYIRTQTNRPLNNAAVMPNPTQSTGIHPPFSNEPVMRRMAVDLDEERHREREAAWRRAEDWQRQGEYSFGTHSNTNEELSRDALEYARQSLELAYSRRPQDDLSEFSDFPEGGLHRPARMPMRTRQERPVSISAWEDVRMTEDDEDTSYLDRLGIEK